MHTWASGTRESGRCSELGDANKSINIANTSSDKSSPETILGRVPTSFVSVGIVPPQQPSEVSLQQPVFASPQDHQVAEETLRTQVSIPNVNCYCAGQGRLWSVRHGHQQTYQQGRQVFLEIQDQASRHWAVLEQLRHLVRVLTYGTTVEAIQVHQTHDPCLDRGRGTRAQPLVPGTHVPSHATLTQPIA